eukprot:1159715-Pelagomonas_calceolata.AAC.8
MQPNTLNPYTHAQPNPRGWDACMRQVCALLLCANSSTHLVEQTMLSQPHEWAHTQHTYRLHRQLMQTILLVEDVKKGWGRRRPVGDRNDPQK